MSDDLHMRVGRLDGRLDALESRADRSEKALWGALREISDKLDSISTQIADQHGVGKGRAIMIQWLISIATTGAAWLGLSHVTWGK